MKISSIIAPANDLRLAIQHAILPSLKAIFFQPSILFHPHTLSELFMAYVWIAFGDGIDEGGGSVKRALITQHAHGVVLDLGAGHGHTTKYLDTTKVTKYIALEPNVLMHDRIRVMAADRGFTEDAGTLVLLGCGAEDIERIIDATGGAPHGVDTLISVLVLCSVPSPQSTISALCENILKPGGQLLFYEHVQSHRADVAWWQGVWTPIWKTAFGGCRLDRPTHLWIQEWKGWSESRVWGKEDEPEEHLFWHQAGRCVRAEVVV